MGVNSLPKTVIRQRRGCDLNPGPSAPESIQHASHSATEPAGDISASGLLVQASVQQEREDVQRARAQHDAETQRHREQIAQINDSVRQRKVSGVACSFSTLLSANISL